MIKRYACTFIATVITTVIATVALNFLAASLTTSAIAQTLAADELVAALQAGGKVIVMRHASSPGQPPSVDSVVAGNVGGERQLDAQGRADATAMGEALRRLQIPIVGVSSSPTWRARETAQLAGFTDVELQPELSNEGMRDSASVQVAWLQTQIAVPPVNGNRLLITHAPNINAAFGEMAAGMQEGEALIFDPGAADGPALVGRVQIAAWADLP